MGSSSPASGNAARRARWDERYAASDLVWSAGPNETLAGEAAELRPGRALDVACGEGRNALWLAEQGWQVTAIDFSTVAIDKARRIAQRRGVDVQWLAADVAEYPLPANSFDLAVVLFLHTDEDERQKWLANVMQALKSGGTLLYVGHDPRNIAEGVGGPQDPRYLPDAAALSEALVGFDVLAAKVIERPVARDPGHGGDADDQSSVALDTFVRAVKR